MSKFERIKICNFCTYFDEQLKAKYEPQGLHGLRLRFQGLMNSFLDSLKITIELHGIIDSKIQTTEKYLKPERKNESAQAELQKQRLI